jgi:hypothetical protein
MSQFENTDLSDLAIERAAIRTGLDFSALFVDPLAYLGPSQVV